MTVVLPSSPLAKRAKPRFLDFGSVMEGSLGGEDQRLTRLGSRWEVDYQLPPMKAEEAQRWIARLVRGKHEGARMYFPQPGYSIAPGAFALANGAQAANAYALNIKAPTGEAGIGEGQFITVTHNGRMYVYQSTTDLVGAGALGIMPSLRSSISADDRVDIGLPMIEGFVTGPEEGWDIDDAKIYGISFTIKEAK